MSHGQKIAAVLLDDGIDRPLDYAIPEEMKPRCGIGVRVLVPLQGRPKRGTIIALKNEAEVASVKQIAELLSEKPLLSDPLFKLANWISSYYCTPLRRVLKVMLPSGLRKNIQKRTQLFVRAKLSRPELLALCEKLRTKKPEQAQVLDQLLLHPKGLLLSALMEKAETSQSPIQTLIKKEILHAEPLVNEESPIDEQEIFSTRPKILREEQALALAKIKTSLETGVFATHLLHGVTGSGKTEVYLQAIGETLRMGKSVIFLVPEIILTSQTLERLRSRFPEKIVLLHHRLSDGERHHSWQEIEKGNVKIVMGARSAIFSPVQNLGLIIIDEEHESSYKQQDEQPTYHARDVALMRAKLENAVVVLGSATPSLESSYNAEQHKFQLSTLQSRGSAELAAVKVVDMRLEFAKAKGFTLFSDMLLEAITKRRSLGEQTILLLNRRGYHTSCLCTSCGETVRCPRCDLALTYHLGEEILSCHLCDYRLLKLRNCPKCRADQTLKYKGAGTEMVERALHAILPGIRTLRLDADTTRHKGSHELIFRQFRSAKADVLIGTQMVAKGLHFPAVTLVGILSADSALNIPDFRAGEKAFQLMTQAAGRAGRTELPGEVIIQTHMPEHAMLRFAAAQDYPAFYREELEVRKLFDFPPFCHLAKVVFSGEDARQVEQTSQHFRNALIRHLPPSVQILPLLPCGHPKVKDKFRFQFLIKGKRSTLLSQKLALVQQEMAPTRKVKTLIDIDPESTFF